VTIRGQLKHLAVLVLIASAVAGAWPVAATACSCAPPPDPGAALEAADAVFAGRVVGLTLVPRLCGEPISSFATEDIAVTVAISAVWKGEPAEQVTIYTAFTCCVCGYPFELGETYLIYATQQGDRLTTTICSRTRPLEKAKDDLAALGRCGWQRVPLQAVEPAEP